MFSPAYPRFDPLAVSWRLPPGLVLEFRSLGARTAVFNGESGDTHLLAPVAADVLARMAVGEVLGGDALAAAVDEFESAGHDPAEALREFHVLGVAEPFEP